MYEKLVAQLQYCATHECMQEGEEEVGCDAPYGWREGCGTCNDVLMLRAADAVEELSKPRWIPVEGKNHPKAYEPVMVVYIGWNDALPHRDCTAYWSEDEDLWRWAETNDKVKVPITHYMPLPPLPEPPKGEEANV